MIPNTWSGILQSLVAHEDLRPNSAYWAMEQLVGGQATDAQIASFLVALATKGPKAHEVIALRTAALDLAVPTSLGSDAVDIVGTGGDPIGVLNISSVASVIVASMGIPVIKHGNKAASSKSGASDLLAQLGVDLTASDEAIERTFAAERIAYLHAANHHPGFRHAAAARSQIGIPTVFNLLGPLANPARPEATAMGVAEGQPIDIVADVFRQRGATALVYRDELGIDKLTAVGSNTVFEITAGVRRHYEVSARDVGLDRVQVDDIRGGTPEENADIARRLLAGEHHPSRSTVLLNSAAAVVAYELYRDPALAESPFHGRLSNALGRVAEAIDSGSAAAKLDAWVASLRA